MNIDTYLYMPPSPSYNAQHPYYKVSPVPHLGKYNIGSKKLTVFYHGNATDSGRMALRILDTLGDNIILPEYPGYGIYKPGLSCDTSIILDDVTKLAKWLIDQKYDVHVIGESIGTGPASSLAKKLSYKGRLVALHLLSPFYSLKRLANDYTCLGLGHLVYDSYPNYHNIDRIKRPVFIYHGKDDSIISYQHALQLSKKANVKLYSYHCDHNDIWDCAHSELLRKLS